MPRRSLWSALVIVVLAVVVPVDASAAAQVRPTRLVSANDLLYQGSFTVPNDGAGTEGTLAYAGQGLAYNPSNDSLFITGHDWHQRTAEITIPTPGVAANPAGLPRASWLTRPTDATDGQLGDIATPREDTYARVGGYLVDGDQLVISGFHYYDAANTQRRSHFVTDTSLGTTGPAVSLSPTIPARWLGGAMAHIPPGWQSAFGGDPWMTGLAGISIASNSSVGPSAATFSPATLQGGDLARLVVGYPLSSPLDGPEAQSEIWNLTSQVKGIVFPEQTGSVLFVGAHGTGPYCYGVGDACGDPVNPHQGTHAYPYRYQVWAYGAADLAAAHAGQQSPESLEPYDVFELPLPYAPGATDINGVAYDSASGRIFVAQALADSDYPVIHVFVLDSGCAPDCGPPSSATCNGELATIDMNTGASGRGTPGADVIVGTDGADVILGQGGDDVICGAGGADKLHGGAGSDTILGGAGPDFITGGLEADHIVGGTGDDVIAGGAGSDRIWGGGGDDIVRSGAGADRARGGAGADKLFGQSGADTLHGDSGNDQIHGGHQSDVIFGGTGDDMLRGAGDPDRVYGQAGDDAMWGGDGTDFLDGGPGNDWAHGQRGQDRPVVTDVSGCIAETQFSC